jgi:hypothetical protein
MSRIVPRVVRAPVIFVLYLPGSFYDGSAEMAEPLPLSSRKLCANRRIEHRSIR